MAPRRDPEAQYYTVTPFFDVALCVRQVTELAPLRSLLECLKEPNLRASFPVLTLCGFAIQICDGMQYLESKRLIHRLELVLG